MGGNGSTSRKVSFGLDEEEKVTVIEGVKLSNEVLRRMREAHATGGKGSPPHPDRPQTPPSASVAEIQEEMRKRFEQEQALVQEQLTRLAQREKERDAAANAVGGGGGRGDVTSSMIMERSRAHEEMGKTEILPAELGVWAKQLERKERELATVSAFYKEQLRTLEQKNLDNYKQTCEQLDQAQSRAESHVRPRCTASICAELQGQVLQCYLENPKQTLACSGLARQYMNCIQQAKQGSSINHG